MSKLEELLRKNIFDASSIVDKKRHKISLSPILDDITGGGFLSGSFVIITGEFKSGKTTACLHIAKQAQRAGYKILFANVEHRLNNRDLQENIGLDLSPEKFEIIQSAEGSILSGDDIIGMIEYKINKEKNLMVILDSFSQLCAQDLQEADIRDRYRDSTPLLLSRFCKRIAPTLGINDNILVGITHEIADQGPSRKSKIEASGRKIQYASDYKLIITHSTPWKESEQVIGLEVNWKCFTTPTAPPFREGVGRIRFGYGLDDAYELVDMAKKLGVVRQSGAWFKYGEESWQGQLRLVSALRENPELKAKIEQEVQFLLED